MYEFLNWIQWVEDAASGLAAAVAAGLIWPHCTSRKRQRRAPAPDMI